MLCERLGRGTKSTTWRMDEQNRHRSEVEEIERKWNLKKSKSKATTHVDVLLHNDKHSLRKN
jgi:hypothetical protein